MSLDAFQIENSRVQHASGLSLCKASDAPLCWSLLPTHLEQANTYKALYIYGRSWRRTIWFQWSPCRALDANYTCSAIEGNGPGIEVAGLWPALTAVWHL